MTTTTKQTSVPLWHYTCPDCGISDEDTGYHGQTHMIFCEVCLEEDRHIKLKRWPVDHDSSPLPAGRLGRS